MVYNIAYTGKCIYKGAHPLPRKPREGKTVDDKKKFCLDKIHTYKRKTL